MAPHRQSIVPKITMDHDLTARTTSALRDGVAGHSRDFTISSLQAVLLVCNIQAARRLTRECDQQQNQTLGIEKVQFG